MIFFICNENFCKDEKKNKLYYDTFIVQIEVSKRKKNAHDLFTQTFYLRTKKKEKEYIKNLPLVEIFEKMRNAAHGAKNERTYESHFIRHFIKNGHHIYIYVYLYVALMLQ